MIALATCTPLPEHDGDLVPLRRALAAHGLAAQAVPWDAPPERFAGADLCVIRSTWDYVRRHDEFLAWTARLSASIPLWNPSAVVRWNSHKGYLLALARAGLPVVPTQLVPQSAASPDLRALLPALGSDPEGPFDVVVKPAISAGSFGTMRVGGPEALAAGQAHLAALAGAGDVLVQPYVPSVDGYGERSLVWIDGAFTHAVRKNPRFAGDAENVSHEAVPIAEEERAVATRVLRMAPGPLLYARVDLVRDEAGAPRLMELELIEPSLFLDRAPAAAARMAVAIARIAAGGAPTPP